jgi:hypothetical protein
MSPSTKIISITILKNAIKMICFSLKTISSKGRWWRVFEGETRMVNESIHDDSLTQPCGKWECTC